MLLDPLLLQAAEERFGNRIVPAVALSTHAGFEVVRAAEASPRATAELRTLIGVDEGAPWPAVTHRREHGIEDQLAVERGSRGPADDLPREQVQNYREIEPALPCPDVRDVGDPSRVWPRHGELPLEDIGDQGRRLANVLAPGAIAVQGAQVVLAHQPLDAMLAAGFSRFAQIEKDARRALDPVARSKRRPDQPQQPHVLLGAIRQRLLEPGVVAARRHVEYAAHRLDAELPLVPLDERVCRANTSDFRLCGHRHLPSWFPGCYDCPLNAGNSNLSLPPVK